LAGASLLLPCAAPKRGRRLSLPTAASPDAPNFRKARRLIVSISSCIFPFALTKAFQSGSIHVTKEATRIENLYANRDVFAKRNFKCKNSFSFNAIEDKVSDSQASMMRSRA
jgi:hypothetical protein